MLHERRASSRADMHGKRIAFNNSCPGRNLDLQSTGADIRRAARDVPVGGGVENLHRAVLRNPQTATAFDKGCNFMSSLILN